MPYIPQVAFSRGEASPLASARTDANFYPLSVASGLNMIVHAEGGASNRPGLEFIAECQTADPGGSVLAPFVYNNEQAYIAEFAAGGISMYAEGELVQGGIGNPYVIGDLFFLRWAQSADVLDVTMSSHQPMQLTRLTPTTFNFAATDFINGPFQDINTDGTTYVYASATQGVVTINASRGIFTPAHVGALFTIQEQFADAIAPWEANKVIAEGTRTPVGLYLRSDSKIYLCVDSVSTTSPSAVATGTFQPVHTSGTQRDGVGSVVPNLANVVGVSWQFVSTNAGCAKITQYISPTQVKAVVQSDKGVYSNFPPTVVGGPQTVLGPFAFSGDGVTTTFSPLTAITSGNPNQFFVTVGGIFADPTTYTISKTGTSIKFNSAPANGAAISVSQVQGTLGNLDKTGAAITMQGLCLSTYWAFGSFSQVQGYPGVVCYFDDRRVFAATTLQPQTGWLSKVSNYRNFGTSSPQVDDDAITFTLNSRRENPIVDLIPMNDLLVGTASTLWRITHSASSGGISPNDIAALPQNAYGQQNVPAIQTGDTVLYAQWGGRKMRAAAYQFGADKFVGDEITVFARHMFPFGSKIKRAAFAPEPFGLVYAVRTDGVMCICTYLPEQQVVAWTPLETEGYFEDVTVIPEDETYAVYCIVRRVLGGATVRFIERFKPREFAAREDLFFVDAGLTYDGRSVSSNAVSFQPNQATSNITNILTSVGLDTLIFTASPHGLSVGQAVNLSGIIATGPFAVNGDWHVTAVPNLFEFAIDSQASLLPGAYTSGGLVTPESVLQGNDGFVASLSSIFAPTDVDEGNQIWLFDSAGNRVRLAITDYQGPTSISVKALDPVPAELVGVLKQQYTFARTVVRGLDHLVGSAVAVQADGAVLPQNTVDADGKIILDGPGGVVHVGLAYRARVQTLNLNMQNAPTIRHYMKSSNRISLVVDSSMPFYAGATFDDMTQSEQREFEPWGVPPALKTGVVHVTIDNLPSDDMAVCIEQRDPAPLTVLALVTDLSIGEPG